MLHACLCTICFLFCYISWHFYVFSGTNLLTRCHSASSLFSAIFVFQKSYTGNILGIGRKKDEVPIFPNKRRSPKQRRRGASRRPHHRVVRPTPGPRTRWCGHLAHLLTPPFRLYILHGEKTLRTRSIFQKTYCKPPPSTMRDREGLEALLGTLPKRGITTRGLLHHHACLQSDV
jgi:hypothetical protein